MKRTRGTDEEISETRDKMKEKATNYIHHRMKYRMNGSRAMRQKKVEIEQIENSLSNHLSSAFPIVITSPGKKNILASSIPCDLDHDGFHFSGLLSGRLRDRRYNHHLLIPRWRLRGIGL